MLLKCFIIELFWGEGNKLRYYTHASNVTEAAELSKEDLRKFRNLTSETEISWKEVVL